jgi:SAM-dependent methyltransferase
VSRTGPDGHVLWDAASRAEIDDQVAVLRQHLDPALPLVDAGCGNGRFARELAAHAPRVIAFDGSESAIAHARREAADAANLEFRVADLTAPGLGDAIHRELGDANVHLRGVLPVLDRAGRLAAVANLRAMIGERGGIYLSETNIASPLDHLEFQGATATTMPEPLLRCIEAGIRPPDRFGDAELDAYFPRDRWARLVAADAIMHGVPLHPGRTIEEIPSYRAVLRPIGPPATA